jgi:hypothetical protein
MKTTFRSTAYSRLQIPPLRSAADLGADHVPARSRSIPPEVLKAVRRQRRVDGRAGDRPMSQPALDCPGVVALVGEGVAAGVPQHVRVGLEFKTGAIRGALDHAGEAGRGARHGQSTYGIALSIGTPSLWPADPMPCWYVVRGRHRAAAGNRIKGSGQQWLTSAAWCSHAVRLIPSRLAAASTRASTAYRSAG